MSRHRVTVDRFWAGDPAVRLSTLAVGGGVAGFVGAIGVLPSAVLLLAIGAFVLVGPGSLLLSWFSGLPTTVAVGLVPVAGLALCILVVSGLLLCGVYAPLPILLGMAAVTVSGGLIRGLQVRVRERPTL